MKATDVISTLQARGIELWQDGGTLRYRAPTGALTERERAALRAHKAAILKALAPPPIGTTAASAPAPVAPALAATEPTGPCPTCGSNHFWLSATGWHCWGCTELPPHATTLCLPIPAVSNRPHLQDVPAIGTEESRA